MPHCWERVEETVRRVWLPEAGGWLYVFTQDSMRNDLVVSSVFVPSLDAWRGQGRTPVSVALDLDHVASSPQPVPLPH